MRNLFRFLLLLAAALYGVAQDGPARQIDEILKRWNRPDTPGASVAVVRNGLIDYQKGFGAANLEYDTPIRPETVFHVASVSKQFTAMALVLLESDGKLSIDDDVRKYLPELPDYGQRITIRNLLQHTSGVRDQWQTLSMAGWRMDDVITQKQILRMLFRQKELNFEPGTRHLYSNGGYTLAAEIVARVSGRSLAEFCDERIFRPLGMSLTHFHDDHRRIVKDRAVSYEQWGDGFRISPLNYANVGATSLFTTAPDLTKWLDNFGTGKVGGEKAIARLQEQAKLSNGEVIPYALGVSVGSYRGVRAISHNGGDAGYRSHVVWFPEHRLGVVVVSNLASFNPTEIAYRVATVYLGEAMKGDSTRPPTPPPGTAKPAPFDSADLKLYPGTYWSEELETQYTVVRKDERVLLDHAHHGEISLTPVGKDEFRGGAWFAPEVKFVRDGSGKVVAMTFGGGRLTTVRFSRR